MDRSPEFVNHSAPSGPAAMDCGWSTPVRYVVTSPTGFPVAATGRTGSAADTIAKTTPPDHADSHRWRLPTRTGQGLPNLINRPLHSRVIRKATYRAPAHRLANLDDIGQTRKRRLRTYSRRSARTLRRTGVAAPLDSDPVGDRWEAAVTESP